MGKHISEEYDAELESIRRRTMEMGGLVEEQLRDAVQALVTHDEELAEKVRRGDRLVNQFEVSIDEECVQIIARRQPTATDLRLLITIMKASTDLERIGDEANRIAKMALQEVDHAYPPNRYSEIRLLNSRVSTMVSGCLDALARLDTDTAVEIIESDKEVDEEYDALIKNLAASVAAAPMTIEQALNVVWSARALERIGDHAKNISEYVLYLVKGMDVRHAPKSELKSL